MKLAKFQADEEGVIRIPKCIAAVWIGMQKDVPTILCFVAESNEMGKNLTFYVKMPGDSVSIDEMHQFATALVTADAEFALFGEKPKIITGGSFPNMPTGGDTPPVSPPSFAR